MTALGQLGAEQTQEELAKALWEAIAMAKMLKILRLAVAMLEAQGMTILGTIWITTLMALKMRVEMRMAMMTLETSGMKVLELVVLKMKRIPAAVAPMEVRPPRMTPAEAAAADQAAVPAAVQRAVLRTEEEKGQIRVKGTRIRAKVGTQMDMKSLKNF